MGESAFVSPPNHRPAFSNWTACQFSLLFFPLTVLNQVFTFPNHQRRGAGSSLVTWPFEHTDKEGLICYLDSQVDGEGIKLYESLGFVKVDECHVDVTMWGLEGTYTHVAMVRVPKKLVLKDQE